MFSRLRVDELAVGFPRVLEEVLLERGTSETDAAEVAVAIQERLNLVNPADVAARLYDASFLQPALEGLPAEFADRPLLEAALRNAIANTYGELGLLEPAEEQSRLAHALYEETLGPDHRDTLVALTSLGASRQGVGDLAGAQARLERALEASIAALGEDDEHAIRTRLKLGTLLGDRDDWEAGREVLRVGLDHAEATLDEGDELTIRLRFRLGVILSELRDAGAEEMLTGAVELARHHLEPNHISDAEGAERSRGPLPERPPTRRGPGPASRDGRGTTGAVRGPAPRHGDGPLHPWLRPAARRPGLGGGGVPA